MVSSRLLSLAAGVIPELMQDPADLLKSQQVQDGKQQESGLIRNPGHPLHLESLREELMITA